MEIIITAPSLDPQENISGVSSVVKFIIDNNNTRHQYIHFGLGKKDKERGGIFRVPSLFHALRNWTLLLDSHPDALVHYSFPLSSGSILRDPWFMWIANRRKMRMVVHVHGGLFLTAPRIPMLYRWIMKKVFAFPVPFIALSEMEVSLIKEKFGAKDVTTIPNCVDLHKAADFQRVKKNGVLTLGFLGRIAKTKGVDYLLNACQMLKENVIPFVMDIAGPEEQKDTYLPAFQSSLGNQFHYSGIVSGKEKVEFLKRIDILIFPTFFEGLPMSMLECMSYGVVPVTTPVGSIPQYIEDGNNGLFIKVRDTNSIINQVNKLHSDRDLLYTMSNQAKRTIFEKFNTESYIKALNALYARVVKQGV